MSSGCTHWRTPVAVGDSAILCSRWLARPQQEEAPAADAAYYLDPAWEALGAASRPGKFTIIDWPDFGAIAADELRALIDEIVEHLRDGRAVEIGCLGAHGRTGTLLAAVIGRAEHLTAAEAIAAARERYCRHAIETPAQVALLEEALSPNAKP